MSGSVLTLHPRGSFVSADGCLSDPGSTDLVFSNISTESANFRQELDSLEANTYDEVRISDGYMPDDYVLEKVLSALRPLGKLLIRGIVSREVGQNLSVDLKIQGVPGHHGGQGSCYWGSIRSLSEACLVGG